VGLQVRPLIVEVEGEASYGLVQVHVLGTADSASSLPFVRKIAWR
jgi:hypothetical protein